MGTTGAGREARPGTDDARGAEAEDTERERDEEESTDEEAKEEATEEEKEEKKEAETLLGASSAASVGLGSVGWVHATSAEAVEVAEAGAEAEAVEAGGGSVETEEVERCRGADAAVGSLCTVCRHVGHRVVAYSTARQGSK
ncbi:unnamed protein product [Closterium sp. NIES-53]